MEDLRVQLSNGQSIPSVGFGTWMILDQQVLDEALDAALEAGCRHFDTAYAYMNETLLGNTFQRWISQGKVTREELFITTKLPNIGMTAEKVEHFLRLSLEKLKLNYLDLYLVHLPMGLNYVDDEIIVPIKDGRADLDMNTDLLAVWKEMENMVELHLTKSIGVCNMNEEQLQRIVRASKIPPVCLQVEMHAYFQQRDIRALCEKLGVTVVAYGLLGSSGREGFNAMFNLPFNNVGLLEDPVVLEIGKKFNKTPAQVLMKFLLQQKVVVLFKSAKPERVRENFGITDFTLGPDDLFKLEQLDKGVEGRSFRWEFFPGSEDHPEFPHKELLL